jgi:hypothetical protein
MRWHRPDDRLKVLFLGARATDQRTADLRQRKDLADVRCLH